MFFMHSCIHSVAMGYFTASIFFLWKGSHFRALAPTCFVEGFSPPRTVTKTTRLAVIQRYHYQTRAQLTNLIHYAKCDAEDPTDESALEVVEGITLKLAFDLGGGVADLSEEKSERFTCGASLDMVHRLRRNSDAVLVGRGTVEFDDCSLTVRRVPPRTKMTSDGVEDQQPCRVVLDPKRTISLDKHKIAKDGLDTILYYKLSKGETETRSAAHKRYPNVLMVGLPDPELGDGCLSMKHVWEDLKLERGIKHVMVEGGPATAKAFLEEKVVDRAILVYAPVEFREPVASGLNHSSFENAGLDYLCEDYLDVDRVEYWSRPNCTWPTTNPSDWP